MILSYSEEHEYLTLVANLNRSNTENVRLTQLRRKRGESKSGRSGMLSHTSGLAFDSPPSDDSSSPSSSSDSPSPSGGSSSFDDGGSSSDL